MGSSFWLLLTQRQAGPAVWLCFCRTAKSTPYTYRVSAFDFGRSIDHTVIVVQPEFSEISKPVQVCLVQPDTPAAVTTHRYSSACALFSAAPSSANNMSAVGRLEKSQNRMRTELPYVAPPGATPEGQQAVYKVRIILCSQRNASIGAPGTWSRPTINALTCWAARHTLILETMGHSSSVMPELWTLTSTSRLPAKRAVESPEPAKQQQDACTTLATCPCVVCSY